MVTRRGLAWRTRTLLAAAVALAIGAGSAAAQRTPDDDIQLGDEPPDDSLLGPTPDRPAPTADDPDDGAGDGEPPAPALDPETARAMAAKLIAGGDDFLKKGDQLARKKKVKDAAQKYERALAAYGKAFELSPEPQLYFAIAQVEDKLAHSLDAAIHYRRFVTDATGARPEQLAKANARLDELKLTIGVLTLAVQPEGAAIELDGAPLGAAPLPEPLFLAPGEHALTITADGYQPSEQKLTVEAGSEAERTFELEPVPAIIVDTPPPPPPPVAPRKGIPGPSKLPMIVGGTVSVALVGGAAATGVMALGRHETFVDRTATDSRRETARTEGKNLALLTDGLILGGVVVAGITAYYYVKVYGPKRRAWQQKQRERAMGGASLDPGQRRGPYAAEPAPGPKLVVTPWVQGSGPSTAAGLSLGGSL
jgi:hypothetical protein